MLLKLAHDLLSPPAAVLRRIRRTTRIRAWPDKECALEIAVDADAALPRQLWLLLDALETFIPGSTVRIAGLEASSRDALASLCTEFAGLRLRPDRHPDRPVDRAILLHMHPFESPGRGSAQRRARRRHLARNAGARWVLMANLELWDGATAARLLRRLCDLPLRPIDRGLTTLERHLLRTRVLSRLRPAVAWDHPQPCTHPRAERMFRHPRRIWFCPHCGMGLGPFRDPPAHRAPKRYGPGYALHFKFSGRREWERMDREQTGRIGRALRELGFIRPPRTSPPPRVLDVGCGGGTYAGLWVGLGFDYLGVDPSPDNIAFARRWRPHVSARFIQGHHEGAAVREAAPFGAFCLIHVLEHVADPTALLADLRGRATPDAWLFIEVPDAPRYTWCWRHRGHANAEHRWDFTAPMLAAIARAAGWTDIRTRHEPDDQLHPFIELLARPRPAPSDHPSPQGRKEPRP